MRDITCRSTTAFVYERGGIGPAVAAFNFADRRGRWFVETAHGTADDISIHRECLGGTSFTLILATHWTLSYVAATLLWQDSSGAWSESSHFWQGEEAIEALGNWGDIRDATIARRAFNILSQRDPQPPEFEPQPLPRK